MSCLHGIAAAFLATVGFWLRLVFAAVGFCCGRCFLLLLLLFAAVAGPRFYCVSGRCILNLSFAFFGMIFRTLMHLKFAVLALRDAFPRWKSSLPDIFIKSG